MEFLHRPATGLLSSFPAGSGMLQRGESRSEQEAEELKLRYASGHFQALVHPSTAWESLPLVSGITRDTTDLIVIKPPRFY